MRCASCGFENPPRFKFCGHCGTPLERAADWGAPAGERRQLSVMFCDLVGSTALSTHLDPEELREIIHSYQEACAGVIDSLEGHVAKYLGDGLLAYFGFPKAHEDDAQKAVRAGLEIAKTVPAVGVRFRTAGSESLDVRVAIHTGLVVVEEIRTGAKLEHVPWGEVPNIAARLQALAEPGTVVISAATARLVSATFECQDLGLNTIQGISSPIRVYRVLRERRIQSPLEAYALTGLTPLVGRDQEISTLLRGWARTKTGTGQVVILTGEPGIGKTRLVRALREHVAERGAWLECRCSPYYQNSAFYPVVELVERGLNFKPDETGEEKFNKLERAVSRFQVSLPEVMPLFASLLSLPQPEAYPLPRVGPAAQRRKTMEAVLGLLQAMTVDRPIVLAVENLQWVDPSTLELLSVFVGRIPPAPILALFTCRPEFHAPWGVLPNLISITLERLPRRETETLIKHVARGKRLPHEVLDQVATKTDGIPLFAEELTKMVLESGLVTEQEDRYTLAGTLPSLAIPATLHDSLMARLDHLSVGRGTAQIAATLGRAFSYELLRAVSPLGDAELESELEALVNAGLLYQHGLPPRATYAFKHALIQDTAYQSLLRSTRQHYHRQIAQALVERLPDTVERQPELLAHHFTSAGLNVEAIGYWKRAGERAVRRSANVEAIAHLNKGLDLLETLPVTAERIQRELELRVTLVVPLIATLGYGAQGVQKTCLRARELCQQLGQVPQLIPVLWGLWQFYVVRAEFQTAREMAEQLLRLAGQDPVARMLAHEALGVTLFFMGEFVQARGHLEQTLALYDPAAHRSLAFSFTQDPDIAGRAYLALVMWALGHYDQAVTMSREALNRAADLAHPFTQTFALTLWNWLFQLRQQIEPIQEQLEAALRLANEQQFALGVAMTTVQRGWALVHAGRVAEGTEVLREGLAGWRATGANLLVPYYLTLISEAAHRHGRAEEGLALIREALTLAGATGERWYEAEMHRLRGELLQQQATPDVQGARAAFGEALEIAKRQEGNAMKLRAAMSMSHWFRMQGEKEDAYRVLAEAYRLFTEGMDTPDLQEARRVLDTF